MNVFEIRNLQKSEDRKEKRKNFLRSLKNDFSFKEFFKFLTRFLNSNVFINKPYLKYAKIANLI